MPIGAPDVVSVRGLVHWHWTLGNPPPIATSKMIAKPWSMASVHAAAPTWLSYTVK